MTKWVSAIIGANIVCFLLQTGMPGFTGAMILVPAYATERPWTLVTYMFLHAGLGHLFFNMLALYFFGPRLESFLGGRSFAILYLASGVGGALLSFMPPYYSTPILGASGAVFGIVTAYARVWPQDRIYLYGVLPVKASWFVVGWVAWSLLGALGLVGAGIAHFGHLGGIAVGFAYMTLRQRHSGSKRFQQRAVASPKQVDGDAVRRWSAIPVATLHEINREEVLRLLEKVRAQGAHTLSPEERATLDRFTPA